VNNANDSAQTKLVSIINITLEDEVAKIKSPMTKIKKRNCSFV
jgi:hypothetical protein